MAGLAAALLSACGLQNPGPTTEGRGRTGADQGMALLLIDREARHEPPNHYQTWNQYWEGMFQRIRSGKYPELAGMDRSIVEERRKRGLPELRFPH